ncbi:ATP-binding protein [Dermacoccaceae bacterium W4C1]
MKAKEIVVVVVARTAARRPRTLAGQFLLLQLAVLGLVLIAVAVITVQQSEQDFRDGRSVRMVAVAESLANTGALRAQLTGENLNPRVLEAEIARATSLSGARQVSVVDAGGRVLASSATPEEGATATVGSPIEAGRSWSGDLRVDGHDSVVGQAPVLSDATGEHGRVLGAVLVSEEYPSWWDSLRQSGSDLLRFLGAAALIGVAGAFILSRLIRRQTRGLEPAEIAGLADHQDALLRGIHEGVIGIEAGGEVTVANAQASALLDLPDDVVGRSVQDLQLPKEAREFLLLPDDSEPTFLVLGGRTLVLNRRRATDRGRFVGTVTTFVDRSDLLALESQVSAQAAITETLRAQTHEFDNQLHTVSGLLQLGEYAEAVEFVDDLSRRRSELSTTITQHVQDPRVAALLVAKTSAAAEAGIGLRLEPESELPRVSAEHAADLLTVLGNLIDNALDATRGHGTEISVRISHYDQAPATTTVRVADTGPGIPAEALHRVFARGWSTKPADPVGRGVGLALVQALCTRSGGSVEAMNGDHGAVLTAVVGTGVMEPMESMDSPEQA